MSRPSKKIDRRRSHLAAVEIELPGQFDKHFLEIGTSGSGETCFGRHPLRVGRDEIGALGYFKNVYSKADSERRRKRRTYGSNATAIEDGVD